MTINGSEQELKSFLLATLSAYSMSLFGTAQGILVPTFYNKILVLFFDAAFHRQIHISKAAWVIALALEVFPLIEIVTTCWSTTFDCPDLIDSGEFLVSYFYHPNSFYPVI